MIGSRRALFVHRAADGFHRRASLPRHGPSVRTATDSTNPAESPRAIAPAGGLGLVVVYGRDVQAWRIRRRRPAPAARAAGYSRFVPRTSRHPGPNAMVQRGLTHAFPRQFRSPLVVSLSCPRSCSSCSWRRRPLQRGIRSSTAHPVPRRSGQRRSTPAICKRSRAPYRLEHGRSTLLGLIGALTDQTRPFSEQAQR